MPTFSRVRGPRALGIIGRVFSVLGVAGLVLAGALAATELRSNRTASADGTLIEAGDRPRVGFTTAGGEVVRFTSLVRSSFFHQGDAVSVAYDPLRPTDAVIDGLLGRWFFAGLAGAISGVFLLVGVGLRFAGRRRG